MHPICYVFLGILALIALSHVPVVGWVIAFIFHQVVSTILFLLFICVCLAALVWWMRRRITSMPMRRL